MKWFNRPASLEDLKAQYKRLALANHPDHGGSTEAMQEINAEYDMLFPVYRAQHNAESTQPTTETAESTRSEFYTQNGWKGENYDPRRSLKEIAQLVRAYCKEFYPGFKFSVRTKYASMCQELICEIKEAPCKVYKDFEALTDDEKLAIIRRMEYNRVFTLTSWNDAELRAEFERVWNAPGGDWYRRVSDQITACAEAVDAYVKSYNYEDIDGMIDYCDVDFFYFGCLDDNGRGIKYVPKTARIKAAPKDEPKPKKQRTASPALRVEFNDEFNGIEVYFPEKPDEATRDALKADGWRWHRQKGCWYNKNTEQHLQALRRITEHPQQLTA